MEKSNRLLKKRRICLLFSLFVFLLLISLSVKAGDGNGDKKNIITGYLSGYFYSGEVEAQFISFHLEYERRLSRRLSLAISVGYTPLLNYYENSGLAWDSFHQKVGDNFSQISDGSLLIFDFGCYIYFYQSDNEEFFAYVGGSTCLSKENYEMIDNKSPLTESYSFLHFSIFSLGDMGIGYSYKINERYSIRADLKMLDLALFFVGQAWPTPRVSIGLSYSF